MSSEIVTAGKSAARCGFEDLAAQINEAHKLAREHAESAIDHAFRAGDLLIEAKGKVQHGHWLPWLRENVQFSERSAQAYMRLTAKRDTIMANIADDDDGISVRQALGHLRKPLHAEYEREAQQAEEAEKLAVNCEFEASPADSARWLEDVFHGDELALGKHLIERPFCEWDMSGEGWMKFFCSKLLYQADLPGIADFALSTLEEYKPLPMLRLVPAQEIAAAINKLEPFTRRDAALPMDVKTMSTARNIIYAAELHSSYYCGALLEEIAHREAIDDETYAAEYEDVRARFVATTKARLDGIVELKKRRERGEFATPEEYWAATQIVLKLSVAHDCAITDFGRTSPNGDALK
jgi:hypothetical protein